MYNTACHVAGHSQRSPYSAKVSEGRSDYGNLIRSDKVPLLGENHSGPIALSRCIAGTWTEAGAWHDRSFREQCWWTDTSQRQGLGTATFHTVRSMYAHPSWHPPVRKPRLMIYREPFCDLGFYMGSWCIAHQWPCLMQALASLHDCWKLALPSLLRSSQLSNILCIISSICVCVCLSLYNMKMSSLNSDIGWKNILGSWTWRRELSFLCSLVLDSSICQTQFGGLQHMLDSARRWVGLVETLMLFSDVAHQACFLIIGLAIAHDLGVLPWSISRDNSYI